jgi:hypothetical protein
MLTTNAGIAIGDATITPPAAANPKPRFLNFLKNLGVGDFNRSTTVIVFLNLIE